MRKEELIELIENLHKEDTQGKLTGVFMGRHGEVITTDSIRIDMDGGRVILAQEGSGHEAKNDSNWQQELNFVRKNNEYAR